MRGHLSLVEPLEPADQTLCSRRSRPLAAAAAAAAAQIVAVPLVDQAAAGQVRTLAAQPVPERALILEAVLALVACLAAVVVPMPLVPTA